MSAKIAKRRSTRTQSDDQTSITGFLKKTNKSGEEPESPGKTSDYGSESASRAQTPESRSDSPSDVSTSSPTTNEAKEIDVKETDIKREVEKVKEEIDEEDVFGTSEDQEGENDASGVKAAIMSGLLSADCANEEERFAAETKRREMQEEAIRKQEEAKEDISMTDRYEKLKNLLGKSKFYTDFLLKKMEGHEAAIKLKKDNSEARAKKRAEKEAQKTPEVRRTGRNAEEAKEVETKKGRGGKAGGKNAKKRKIGEEEGGDEKENKKAKVEKDTARTFEGRDVPYNQPLLLTGGIMRDYQMEGYEWMASLWENGINGILADEMGLGKTIQTVALFCHLYEMGVTGPFLVIGPLSTVPNWVNEFKRFAPKIPCILYHGNVEERLALREKMATVTHCDDLDGGKMHNVVVTSYEIAMNDRMAFQNIMWRYIVVDEGHRLKNNNCRLIKELKMYHSANRLLLTGTPLQNNLKELWSLLNFLLPEIFDDLRVFESWFDAKNMHESEDEKKRVVAQEMQNNILTTLHQILTPFLLRRVKSDVDLQIPPKKEVLVYCPLTDRQRTLYQAVLDKALTELYKEEDKEGEEVLPEKRKRTEVDYKLFLDDKEYVDDDKMEAHLAKINEVLNKRSIKTGSSAYEIKDLKGREKNFSVKSRMADMRKTVNHPYLIEYPLTECGNFYNSTQDMVHICGKLQVLDQMLTQLLADGHKVLIFSQMTRMLDILGDYLSLPSIKKKFCRLDGSMNFIDRQANIDKFNTSADHSIFLLSTRAGGLGINLTAADTCIIYDSDWNPQQDLQAQDRCHRIGQTKPVMVYRLVTANTIDQRIVERAAAKRRLEKMVIHKSKFKAGAESISTSLKSISPDELLNLLDSKDHVGAVMSEDYLKTGKVFTDAQLSKLLDRRDLSWGAAQVKEEVKVEQELEGVFKVVDQEGSKKGELGSVRE